MHRNQTNSCVTVIFEVKGRTTTVYHDCTGYRMPTFSQHIPKSSKKLQSFCISLTPSITLFLLLCKCCKGLCLVIILPPPLSSPSLSFGYYNSMITYFLHCSWRWISDAGICLSPSPVNDEANNSFSYLLRVASPVNKLPFLSPGDLAFFFIRFFLCMYMKHRLLFILISHKLHFLLLFFSSILHYFFLSCCDILVLFPPVPNILQDIYDLTFN